MKLSEMSWPEVDQLPRETPVVIPIAAIEQHGHHLPLVTDSLLLGEILERVEASANGVFLGAPLQWLGNSHHHLDFAGTLSAPPRVYLDLLVGIVENFIRHGFQRLILLNGHGGNDVPGKQAMFEVRQTYRQRSDLLLLFSTYWALSENVAEMIPGLHQQDMGHACEWETSMVLRIAPHLVGDYKSAAVVEPGNPFRPASRAWITKDRSDVGHIGWPHLATPEKGEKLLAKFADGVEKILFRMKAWDGRDWNG